jgi:hypothetical protein
MPNPPRYALAATGSTPQSLMGSPVSRFSSACPPAWNSPSLADTSSPPTWATRSSNPAFATSARTAAAIPAGSNPPALVTTLIPRRAISGRCGTSWSSA